MLARVKHETTVTLRELTGSEEASMTFFAVRRWYGWGAGPILNLDIGGGSFEMAFGQDELPELAMSVPLGASRLTRDWLPEDPPSARSVKELRRHIRATLKPAVRSFEKLGRANLVAGTSKTFRSLARIAGAAPSAAGPYVKRELLSADLGLWAQRISAMEIEDRLHLPAVSEARAPQLLAGALVAEAALEMFEFPNMEICPWALREGLILRRLDQLVFDGPLEPAPHVTPGAPAGTAVAGRNLEPVGFRYMRTGGSSFRRRRVRAAAEAAGPRPVATPPNRQGGRENVPIPAQHLPARRTGPVPGVP